MVCFDAGVSCAHGASRSVASARGRFIAAQPIWAANEEMNHTGSRERRKFTAERRKQSRCLLRGQVETPLSALGKCKTLSYFKREIVWEKMCFRIGNHKTKTSSRTERTLLWKTHTTRHSVSKACSRGKGYCRNYRL